MKLSVEGIISGGQTGVDRAALDVAIDLGIPHGGWCPRGRRSEDGRVPDGYGLTEHDSPLYVPRTRANIDGSDGTLIVATRETFTGGTELTYKLCETTGKTRFVVLIDESYYRGHEAHGVVWPAAALQVWAWASGHNVRTLNVAGPRASRWRHGYAAADKLLRMVLAITDREES